MAEGATPPSNAGAHWLRWEPHVHAPGTVLNDQFKGKAAWEEYLTALESLTPELRAIGITDYYSTETYERVVEPPSYVAQFFSERYAHELARAFVRIKDARVRRRIAKLVEEIADVRAKKG
jgi:hypothetical protein